MILTQTNLILLNQLTDAADSSIFPILYKSISDDFNIGPSTLGFMSLSQTLARSLSCPIWGFMADKVSKRRLLSFGVFVWSSATALSGYATTIHELIFYRIICGLGLGCVSPILQSLVAESQQGKRLGYAFGLLSLAGMAGSFIGTSLGNNVDWRTCFKILGALSYLLAWLDFRLLRNQRKRGKLSSDVSNLTLKQLFAEMVDIFRSPSIRIVMAQGIIGTMPWIAMSYINLFFQNTGFSPYEITILQTAFTFSIGIGGFIGGILGDKANKKIPYIGRVATAQVSVFIGIPIVVWMFSMTASPDLFTKYFLLLTVLGICCSWCSSGCNRPLFCDIVPDELRSTAISWVVAVDDSLSGLMAPFVGYLSEKYGFIKGNSTLKNAEALRKSLQVTMVYPWIICLISYSALYKTYPLEVKRKQRKMYDHFLRS